LKPGKLMGATSVPFFIERKGQVSGMFGGKGLA